MKKDRKKRKEAIKRLEKLEDMNRAGENVSSLDLIGALYPKFVFATWREKRDKETCAELLEEVKSLVDVKDYITCPRSKEGRAIHIGDKVYKVDGDGEPLIVEEIIVRNGGSMVQCRYANHSNCKPVERTTTNPVYFSRELTFGTTSLYSRLDEMTQKLEAAYQELQEQIKKEGFSLDAFLYQL